MQIKLNNDGEITGYAVIGNINGIEVEIPQSVLNDNPLSYKYTKGKFVKNADYKPPEPPEITDVEQMAFDHEYRLSALELGI